MNKKDGTMWMDVSTVKESRGEADKLAHQFNQIAYWDVAGKAELPAGGTGEKKRKLHPPQ